MTGGAGCVRAHFVRSSYLPLTPNAVLTVLVLSICCCSLLRECGEGGESSIRPGGRVNSGHRASQPVQRSVTTEHWSQMVPAQSDNHTSALGMYGAVYTAHVSDYISNKPPISLPGNIFWLFLSWRMWSDQMGFVCQPLSICSTTKMHLYLDQPAHSGRWASTHPFIPLLFHVLEFHVCRATARTYIQLNSCE